MAEIKPEQVSREVAMAAKMSFLNATGPDSIDDWHVAVAAALNAWPGMGIHPVPHWPGPNQEVVQVPSIILPIPPQEKTDA